MTAVLLLISALVAMFHGPSESAATKRAHITGIDHVAFYTTNADAVNKLYTQTLGLQSIGPIEASGRQRFMVGSQWVGYATAPDVNSTSRLDHIAFATDDLESLRKQLETMGVRVRENARRPHTIAFTVDDPEGNHIEFVQQATRELISPPGPDAVSHRLIHAGFTVRDRAAEDHFYKDLLGFHLYWQGGPQPDRTDWVAMQVPDGTDWLEYMLNQPEHLDLHRNGVMDHISLGVGDMKQAEATLDSRGWRPSETEHIQMGRDGKWQLNLYDPDFTRIELMEFRPAQKPCCSQFQGPHPSD